MNAQRYRWLVAAALLATLAGCLGGSGSSGFDITEDAAIREAVDTNECQDFEGLLICPAEPGPIIPPSATPTKTPVPVAPTPTAPEDTPTHPAGTPNQMTPTFIATPSVTQTAQGTQTPTRTATIPSQMSIETNVRTSNDIVCAGGDTDPCSFNFVYVAVGFPDEAQFRTASRVAEGDPWLVSIPTAISDPRPAHEGFADMVVISASSSAPGSETTVQFAVLVFFTDPGALPASVIRLGDTGADSAYVLPPVPVSSISR